jgi:hypothetical protein
MVGRNTSSFVNIIALRLAVATREVFWVALFRTRLINSKPAHAVTKLTFKQANITEPITQQIHADTIVLSFRNLALSKHAGLVNARGLTHAVVSCLHGTQQMQ